MPKIDEALDAILRSLAAQGRARLDGTAFDGAARVSDVTVARPLPPLPASAATSVHLVKVTLRGARPAVWRRLDVPSDLPLSGLHEGIQTAFAWFDCPLHQLDPRFSRSAPPAQHNSSTPRAAH